MKYMSDIDRIKTCISGLKEASVLVVGDIMLDRFVYGGVERISPESPVPVLSVSREDVMLGGAGNALANLAGLGAQGHIVSVVGDDAEGRAVIQQVKALGFETNGLVKDVDRPTIVKTRFLAGHQQLLRTDYESKEMVSSATRALILDQAKAVMGDVSAMLISDYGKGLLGRDLIAALIKAAKKHKLPVIVDPKGSDFTLYKGASIITPNKKELSEATDGAAVDSDEDIIAASECLIKECGLEAVVATRSKDGMSLIQKKNAAPLHLRNKDIEVFDVSGAGDSVIATIAAALASGAALEDAARLANAAGSIVVTKVGTAPIRVAELEAHFSEQQSRQAAVMGWNDAVEQVKRWRARGLKVGFTNGCFDILHFGHVSYLNEARQNCDRLIIGLNSDASVKILKGEGRPVHDEDARAAVLGSLAAVDMVVLFGAEKVADDNTANALLESLQPDIYFKGGDYTVDQIPEAPIVQGYGGVVKVLSSFEGHSTTNSIKKINNETA